MLGSYDGSICLKNFTKLVLSYSFIFTFAQKGVQRFWHLWYLWYIFLTGLLIFVSSSRASVFSITPDIFSSLTFPSGIQLNAGMSFTAWRSSWLGSATAVVVVLLPLLPPSCLSHLVVVEGKSSVSFHSFFSVGDCASHSYFLICFFFNLLREFYIIFVVINCLVLICLWFVIIQFFTCLFGKNNISTNF